MSGKQDYPAPIGPGRFEILQPFTFDYAVQALRTRSTELAEFAKQAAEVPETSSKDLRSFAVAILWEGQLEIARAGTPQSVAQPVGDAACESSDGDRR
jgi:hypothetical protein